MTPGQIPLDSLSSRELLILAVQSLNTLTTRHDAHQELLYGKGARPGLKTQVTLLWILAGGLWSIVLVAAAGVIKG